MSHDQEIEKDHLNPSHRGGVYARLAGAKPESNSMAASRLCSAAAIAAAFTSASMSPNRAYADSQFRFPFFSSSSSTPSESQTDQPSPETDERKGSGFDPESLERGAKALREINNSPHSKQVEE